jgi:two-component sensor histidine kinase
MTEAYSSSPSAVSPPLAVRPQHAAETTKRNALDPRLDFIDRLAQWIDETPPYSWRAANIAIASVAIASLIRGASGFTGPDLRLVTYGPAILATGLLAGVPAAIAAAIVSCVIVYWAFTAPFFQFKWLIPSDQIAFALFEVAAAFTILFAYWCRTILGRMRSAQITNDMITRELEHRGRNTFAIMEVIVQKSLPHDSGAAADILGRMRAVQYANELLTKPVDTRIHLGALLVHEFAAFGAERLIARGPSLQVSADTARHLVLIIHEFVTNAAKYGSLSVPQGKVLATWGRDGDAVVLDWRVRGGPQPEEPDRKGFGSKLVAQCVKALDGTCETVYTPEGLDCRLRFKA